MDNYTIEDLEKILEFLNQNNLRKEHKIELIKMILKTIRCYKCVTDSIPTCPNSFITYKSHENESIHIHCEEVDTFIMTSTQCIHTIPLCPYNYYEQVLSKMIEDNDDPNQLKLELF